MYNTYGLLFGSRGINSAYLISAEYPLDTRDVRQTERGRDKSFMASEMPRQCFIT